MLTNFQLECRYQYDCPYLCILLIPYLSTWSNGKPPKGEVGPSYRIGSAAAHAEGSTEIGIGQLEMHFEEHQHHLNSLTQFPVGSIA